MSGFCNPEIFELLDEHDIAVEDYLTFCETAGHDGDDEESVAAYLSSIEGEGSR